MASGKGLLASARHIHPTARGAATTFFKSIDDRRLATRPPHVRLLPDSLLIECAGPTIPSPDHMVRQSPNHCPCHSIDGPMPIRGISQATLWPVPETPQHYSSALPPRPLVSSVVSPPPPPLPAFWPQPTAPMTNTTARSVNRSFFIPRVLSIL